MKRVKVAVAVIVRSDGKVLLTQRHSPDSPNVHLKWQLPGGGIEKGETPTDACLREIEEETGLSIRILSKKPVVVAHEYDSITYVLHAFKAQVISGTIDITKDEETADAKWYATTQIATLETLDDTLQLVSSCLI